MSPVHNPINKSTVQHIFEIYQAATKDRGSDEKQNYHPFSFFTIHDSIDTKIHGRFIPESPTIN